MSGGYFLVTVQGKDHTCRMVNSTEWSVVPYSSTIKFILDTDHSPNQYSPADGNSVVQAVQDAADRFGVKPTLFHPEDAPEGAVY